MKRHLMRRPERSIASLLSIVEPRPSATPSSARASVYEFLRGANETSFEQQHLLVSDEPGLTGDNRYDALLAGLAEHSSNRNGFALPAWATQRCRFLDQAWYWIDLPGYRRWLRGVTPAAFARRHVYLDPIDLTSA